jgi:hypothetical protein
VEEGESRERIMETSLIIVSYIAVAAIALAIASIINGHVLEMRIKRLEDKLNQ